MAPNKQVAPNPSLASHQEECNCNGRHLESVSSNVSSSCFGSDGDATANEIKCKRNAARVIKDSDPNEDEDVNYDVGDAKNGTRSKSMGDAIKKKKTPKSGERKEGKEFTRNLLTSLGSIIYALLLIVLALFFYLLDIMDKTEGFHSAFK